MSHTPRHNLLACRFHLDSDVRTAVRKQRSRTGVPLRESGGGPAGFIAAIAAARGGARTALVERYGFLGGMATMGYVAPISEFGFAGERVIGGIPWESIGRLEELGGAP